MKYIKKTVSFVVATSLLVSTITPIAHAGGMQIDFPASDLKHLSEASRHISEATKAIPTVNSFNRSLVSSLGFVGAWYGLSVLKNGVNQTIDGNTEKTKPTRNQGIARIAAGLALTAGGVATIFRDQLIDYYTK